MNKTGDLAPMGFRLTLLGYPRLTDRTQRAARAADKTFALAAFLLLRGHGNSASRATIRQVLWDSTDEKQASANMRKFLARERQRVEQGGERVFDGEGAHVTLVMPSDAIDLADFLRLTAAHGAADIIPLCEMYRGDLLEGFAAEEPHLNEWIEAERTKIRDLFVSTLSELIEPGHDVEQVALRVGARRLIDVDPYNETAHRALMRLFAEEGEPARVRETYNALERRLREELDAQPDAETIALLRVLAPRPSQLPSLPLSAAPSATVPAAVIVEDPEHHRRRSSAWVALQDRAGVPRIAILPPPASSDVENQRLAASFVEDVTLGLCRLRSLAVVAPRTASAVSGQGRKRLRELQIDYAVEIALISRGASPFLDVRLVDTLDGDHMTWAERYPFDMAHTAHNYSELSLRIVRSLVEHVERVEIARYARDPHPMAYHLFLAGQHEQSGTSLPKARRARRFFRLALVESSDFVPALSGLARTYQVEWLLMARGDIGLLDEAERLARESVSIDPDDARGYRELGTCALFTGRFDEALEALERGSERNPQYADLLADQADALTHASEPARALAKINAAIALNPICPDHYWWTAGGANFHLHRYRDAIEAMERMRDRSPAYRLLAASWAMLGEREQAAIYRQKATEIHPDFSVSGWLSIVPLRDSHFAAHYEAALREAGFD